MEEGLELRLVVPEGVCFGDLHLQLTEKGTVALDVEPIIRICMASNLDPALFLDSHEDQLGSFIARWYIEHRRRGGPADPLQEYLMGEADAKERLGFMGSFPAGRA